MKYSFIIAVLFLCSCSVTKKNKTYSKSTESSKIDSTTNKTLDSGSVKKDNSISITEKKDDYEKETVIEFFEEPKKNIDNNIDTSWNKVFPEVFKGDVNKILASDYFPSGIKKITVKEKGVKTEVKKELTNTIDSNFNKKNENTNVKKEENKEVIQTTKNKTTKSYWWYLLLLLLIPIWYYRKKLGHFYTSSNK